MNTKKSYLSNREKFAVSLRKNKRENEIKNKRHNLLIISKELLTNKEK
jgi:hypothetical protein